MLRHHRMRFLLVSLSLLLNSIAFGQERSVSLRFINSATGYSITPDEMTVTSERSGASKTFAKENLAATGFSTLSLEDGTCEAIVHAAGFHSLSTRIHAGSGATYDFFLDPITLPRALQSDMISALHKSEATVVVGFIVDEATGSPLSNAVVSTSSGSSVRTDNAGFYKLYLLNTEDGRLSVNLPGYSSEERTNIELWSNGDWIINFRLQKGTGERSRDMGRASESGSSSNGDAKEDCVECSAQTKSESAFSPDATIVLPNSIRVGRTCVSTSCTTVQVYTLETYVKYVLPAEWYSCWGSLTNGTNSLRSGAVAVRSYGLWYVYNPISSLYDICDNTSCQAFGSSQSTNANNAVDATARYILTNAGLTAVMRSEYSAENNNKGCGDGYTGTGSSWPCIYDPVCQTQTPNGHGRGLCQWGTARWASGTRVLTTSPCAMGVSHGFGSKTWQEILTQYYPSYALVQGGNATILSATPTPNTVAQGATFTISYSIDATDAMPVMLAASIAPTGTTTYTSNSANDVKVNLISGSNTPSRSFTVPVAESTGLYDLYVALWYDKNNNNTIDGSDFVINSQTYVGALTINQLPVQLVSFTASVRANNNVELNWRTLSEISNYGFFVQKRRAQSGELWTEIPGSFVAGHGTTNIPHDYEFTDLNVPNGTWQYRLRQVDLGGGENFADPIQVSIVTSVAENSPAEFKLYQNYPNPFNPLTNFQFSIVSYQLSILKIYDMLGREVATLINEPLAAGMHTVAWDATGFPSGVYTYKLTSGGRSQTRRLVLLR
jgi:hypothetical protein